MMTRVRLGVLMFVALSAATLVAQQPIYLPAEVEGGGRLYTGSCTGCHGPEGDGVAGVNFSRGQYRRASSDQDIVRIILRGIPGTAMPPNNFSEGAASTIVAYLRSMAGGGGSSASGDANRGRAVFEGKGGCLSCHSVGGNGSRIGPTLTEVGALRRVIDLERSVLDPDAEIRPENRTVRVVGRDGAVTAGWLMNQDTFTLQILDSKERLLLFEKANLREYAILTNSPMPSYRGKLSAQEIADVVSYLVSLRGRS